jgi:hypothetical protein
MLSTMPFNFVIYFIKWLLQVKHDVTGNKPNSAVLFADLFLRNEIIRSFILETCQGPLFGLYNGLGETIQFLRSGRVHKYSAPCCLTSKHTDHITVCGIFRPT